jgi:hypothetical protein
LGLRLIVERTVMSVAVLTLLALAIAFGVEVSWLCRC